MGAPGRGRGGRRADAGHARRDGHAVADGDGAGLLRPQPTRPRRGRADQRAAGHRPLAQRRAARAVRRARPRAPRAGRAAAEHALRRAVLRSRQQATVPDEPPRDPGGDRRARGRDGARAHAERHRSGGGAARCGRAAAPGAEHVRAAHAAGRADRRRAAGQPGRPGAGPRPGRPARDGALRGGVHRAPARRRSGWQGGAAGAE